jgi:hypothetical protein
MWNMLCHFSLKSWDGWKYMNDLGFCNLHILIEVHPNENDFDDRYRMGAYWIN